MHRTPRILLRLVPLKMLQSCCEDAITLHNTGNVAYIP
jgi:hypothetical protein